MPFGELVINAPSVTFTPGQNGVGKFVEIVRMVGVLTVTTVGIDVPLQAPVVVTV